MAGTGQDPDTDAETEAEVHRIAQEFVAAVRTRSPNRRHWVIAVLGRSSPSREEPAAASGAAATTDHDDTTSPGRPDRDEPAACTPVMTRPAWATLTSRDGDTTVFSRCIDVPLPRTGTRAAETTESTETVETVEVHLRQRVSLRVEDDGSVTAVSEPVMLHLPRPSFSLAQWQAVVEAVAAGPAQSADSADSAEPGASPSDGENPDPDAA